MQERKNRQYKRSSVWHVATWSICFIGLADVNMRQKQIIFLAHIIPHLASKECKPILCQIYRCLIILVVWITWNRDPEEWVQRYTPPPPHPWCKIGIIAHFAPLCQPRGPGPEPWLWIIVFPSGTHTLHHPTLATPTLPKHIIKDKILHTGFCKHHFFNGKEMRTNAI